MYRLMIATALVLGLPVAATAQADGIVSATPGAIAGRSPHQAYRLTNTATSCPTAMHSLPAGKLPVYGVPHVALARCEEARIAKAGSSSVQAAR